MYLQIFVHCKPAINMTTLVMALKVFPYKSDCHVGADSFAVVLW